MFITLFLEEPLKKKKEKKEQPYKEKTYSWDNFVIFGTLKINILNSLTLHLMLLFVLEVVRGHDKTHEGYY